MPGFVDTHIHYPQSEMVGAYGEQLLEWLNKHTFPTERRYEDLEYAREMSAFFIKQLLRNGTTSALVLARCIRSPWMRYLKPPAISICA